MDPGLEAMREISQRDLRPLVMRLYDPEDAVFQGVAEAGCVFVAAFAGERAPALATSEVARHAVEAAGGSDLGRGPWLRWRDHAYPQGCCAYFTFAGAADTEAAAQDAYRACWDQAMEACLAHGATIGHHHGVGQARAAWARREMGGWEPFWSALRDAADPAHVMSPRGAGGR